PIVVTVLMGLSPLAPAWYVLALSLMGLVLGMWLRQSEGCLARPAGNTHGTVFLKKP
ncbi:MFS transporter, partial [Enterobacter intestinihominis]